MKITRRDFIKFAVGGVAGIHVTPLPWKLTDDIAIWTQNWPWVPVPERGEFKERHGICSLCPGGCGIRLRMVESRGVKIEGRDGYPINKGGICPIGMGGLQLLYNKDMRFTEPMKRVGPRGEGVFMEISWDEALEILVKRLSQLRSEGRANEVGVVDGLPYDSTSSVLLRRFVRAFGTQKYFRILDQDGVDCLVNYLVHGYYNPMGFDLENSDLVLSFNAGLLEGWGSAGRVLGLWGEWKEKGSKNKVKVIYVGSRSSNTASKCDKWVAIRPGTEAALALGIAHVIVKMGRYNSEFVNEKVFGLGDWIDGSGNAHKGLKALLAAEYTPDRVAHIAGVKVEDITALAKELLGAKAPVVIWGRGKGTLPMSVYETWAIHTLNVLLGRINRPGGVIVSLGLPFAKLPEPIMDEVAKASLDKQGEGPLGGPSLYSTLAEIAKSERPLVDTLLVVQANPVQTLPSANLVERAIRKIPFIVSFSPFRDDTAFYADLILPDHVYLEKLQEVPNPRGVAYPAYCVSMPIIRPLYNTKDVGDTIILLAKKMGGSLKDSFDFKSLEEVIKTRAAGLIASGKGSVNISKAAPWDWKNTEFKPSTDKKDLDKLFESNLWYVPISAAAVEDKFNTESGKIELYSQRLKALPQFREKKDELFLPHFPVEEDGGGAIVLEPYEMVNWSSSWVPSPPYLTKTITSEQLLRWDLFGQLNPNTARELGLKKGDLVRVISVQGEILLRIELYEGAMPGVLYVPMGFGHIGYDEFLKGKGANVNRVIAAKADPIGGYPLGYTAKINLLRVTERG